MISVNARKANQMDAIEKNTFTYELRKYGSSVAIRNQARRKQLKKMANEKHMVCQKCQMHSFCQSCAYNKL